MKIIVHSSLSAQTIQANLGNAEYSYFFVLEGYLPALMRLGEVVTIDDPETEVDAIFDACQAARVPCVFLCFAPPHLVPITLRCPTIPVVAWEFSTIPCEIWGDDPRCDWRVVFSHCKRVIALSNHTVALVRAAMGEDFPVFAIPTASYEAFADTGPARPVNAESQLHLQGYLFDSAVHARYTRNPPWPHVAPPHFGPPLPPLPEAIPPTASPPVPIRLTLRERISKTVYYLQSWYGEVLFDVLPAPAKRIISASTRLLRRTYRGVPKTPPSALQLPPPPPPPAAPLLQECEVTLGGVVYTSVISPLDGRKNWQDMLTGFLWAFRDNPGATLFLKVPGRGGVAAYPEIHEMLNRFAPFKCRVVYFAGYLDAARYKDLVRASTYYVSTSHAEGLCLPLVEFLSAGRPAVAPGHTAMADYINTDIGFVLQASLEHNVWPFDPRDIFTTMRYRLDWESVVTAFEQSYALAIAQGSRYAAMADAAQTAMHEFCARDVVQAKLAEALGIAVPEAMIQETGLVAA